MAHLKSYFDAAWQHDSLIGTHKHDLTANVGPLFDVLRFPSPHSSAQCNYTLLSITHLPTSFCARDCKESRLGRERRVDGHGTIILEEQQSNKYNNPSTVTWEKCFIFINIQHKKKYSGKSKADHNLRFDTLFCSLLVLRHTLCLDLQSNK